MTKEAAAEASHLCSSPLSNIGKELLNHHDRTLGLLHNVLADAAKQYALHDAKTAAAHDDEVDVVRLCKIKHNDGG